MTASSVLAALVPAVADDIREIRGPIAAPPGLPWWLFAVIAASAIAVPLLVWAILRWRRRPLSPHVQALRALAAARPLIDRGDPHGFSMVVSDAVRWYVEHAFAVHAPRRTTDELLADLMTDGSPVAAHRDELGLFLQFCDLAKYARWSLSPTHMTGMLASAEAFVRATASPPNGARA
jgi:hypothetical protein